MSVRVQCRNPDCQASFSVAPGDEGLYRRCPKCGLNLSGIDDPPGGSGQDWAQPLPPGPPVGSTFAGRYVIEKVLGRGGMGSVLLAHDKHLDRKVAIKIPHFNFGLDSEHLKRFLREARAAARFQHPNICPIHDVGESNGQFYLTLAYIEGRTLEERTRGRTTEPRSAAKLVRTLARALFDAHQQGIVHRDLKPSNVMVTPRGELIIMDFGLAKRLDGVDSLKTQSGVMMGTPAYMPPEQFRGDVAAMGPPCDIYSLGVILYQLLTNRLPYEGSAMNIMAQMLVGDPPPPLAHRPDLDPELDAICRKAMSRKIADRYGTMKEFADALGAHLRRVLGISGVNDPASPGAQSLPAAPFSVPPVDASVQSVRPRRGRHRGRGRRWLSPPSPSRSPSPNRPGRSRSRFANGSSGHGTGSSPGRCSSSRVSGSPSTSPPDTERCGSPGQTRRRKSGSTAM
jgi:serine/threonine protein kinase